MFFLFLFFVVNEILKLSYSKFFPRWKPEETFRFLPVSTASLWPHWLYTVSTESRLAEVIWYIGFLSVLTVSGLSCYYAELLHYIRGLTDFWDRNTMWSLVIWMLVKSATTKSPPPPRTPYIIHLFMWFIYMFIPSFFFLSFFLQWVCNGVSVGSLRELRNIECLLPRDLIKHQLLITSVSLFEQWCRHCPCFLLTCSDLHCLQRMLNPKLTIAL